MSRAEESREEASEAGDEAQLLLRPFRGGSLEREFAEEDKEEVGNGDRNHERGFVGREDAEEREIR